MPANVVVASVINPLTLLPRRSAPKHYADAFYQEINAIRSRFISIAIFGFAAPLVTLSFLLEDASMQWAAIGAAATFVLAGVVTFAPAVRNYLLKGRRGDVATAVIVVAGYSFLTVSAFMPMRFNQEYGGIRVTRRMLYSTLIVVCGMVLHTNIFVLGLCHSLMLAGNIVLAFKLEANTAAIWATVASFLVVQGSLFAVFYDLSRMRCTELFQREVIIAEKSKSSAHKLNRDFICQVLHDLGTPLSAIMLGLSSLSGRLEQCLEADDQEMMSEMMLACTHINSLRDRAIKFAKFNVTENGEVPIANSSAVDIRQVIQTTIQPLAKSISRNNNVDFRCTVHPDVPALFETDGEWIVDILLNLLSNAVKFTTEGWVALNVVLETDRCPDQNFVRFEVVDTGVGISQSDKAKLFNPLAQSDEAADAARGAGLGLWSVRMKVKALGGFYDVTDNYPQGAIFGLSIPAINPSAKPTASTTLQETNARFGFTVRGNLVEVDSAQGAPQHTPPCSHSQAPALEETPRVSPAASISSFEQELENSQASLESLEMVSPKRKTRVLVIDDQSVIRRMLRRGLEKYGIQVDEASNGVEGLEKMKQHAFDCVISDITMPGLGGLEMIREYRSWESNQASQRHQLVYAFSGTCLEGTRNEALDAGMDDFYAKPLDIDSVVARIPGFQEHDSAPNF